MARAVLEGKPLQGTWFDRTEEYRAKLRGENFEPRRYATEEIVVLSQLPCWRHFRPEVYRGRVAELIQEIEADGVAERKLTSSEPLGRKAILRQNPHTRPSQTKKSCCPLFHAASKAAREELKKACGLFLSAPAVSAISARLVLQAGSLGRT